MCPAVGQLSFDCTTYCRGSCRMQGRPYSCSRYFTGIYCLQVRLRQWNIIKKRLESFAVEKTRRITPGCKLVPFQYGDPFHKWLPIINSLVSITISLTKLAFE